MSASRTVRVFILPPDQSSSDATSRASLCIGAKNAK